MKTKNFPVQQEIKLQLGSQTLNVLPQQKHVFLMRTKDVAQGYGVDAATIRGLKTRHSNELIEETHFLKAEWCFKTKHPNPKGVSNSNTPALQPHETLWTKTGIIRLGFFIRTEKAAAFRTWAETLILETLANHPSPSPLSVSPQKTLSKKLTQHNRLTDERINRIMRLLLKVEPKSLRLNLAAEILTPNQKEVKP